MDASTKPSIAMRDAAVAAAKAAAQAGAHAAVVAAAVNAAKPGKSTSEFWAAILAPALTAAAVVGLKVLGGAAAVSMPWLSVPLAAAAAGVGAFGYARSRGDVKAAALAGVVAAAGVAAPEVVPVLDAVIPPALKKPGAV